MADRKKQDGFNGLEIESANQLRRGRIIDEYDFVKSNNAIFRVFGKNRYGKEPLLLLRYWFDKKIGWVKPPKHASESGNKTCESHYLENSSHIDMYGIKLGTGIPEESVIYSCCDAIRKIINGDDLYCNKDITRFVAHMTKIFSEVLEIEVCQIGLTGSVLVGLSNDASDIDYVLFTDQPPGVISEKLMKLPSEFVVPYPDGSTMARKFKSVFSGLHIDWFKRGVYSLCVGARKIDLHFASQNDRCCQYFLPDLELFEKSKNYRVIITDASNRHFFPCQIQCVLSDASDDRLFTLVSMDHAVHFLLEGDTVELCASLFRLRNSDLKNFFLVCSCINAVYSQ